MTDTLKLDDIYDKHINFLIGSGASFGLLPTLALAIRDEFGESQSIEKIATRYDNNKNNRQLTALFMYYYKKCIEPAINTNLNQAGTGSIKKEVFDNYETFLKTLLVIMQRRRVNEKNCNIFTTNYDGCFAHAADNILRQGSTDFIVNDGARGFSRRYLQAKNFNSFVYQTGIFERHIADIPQINLIHLHGSVYWKKDGDNILVDYFSDNDEHLLPDKLFKNVDEFFSALEDDSKTLDDLPVVSIHSKINEQFWGSYNNLPIVNPTKWKFHETVFEEHYYQMLRLLSYELEKPNSIFITFGFSFSDEHILNLVKRSLSNPALQLFICCFNGAEILKMQGLFKFNHNVKYISVDGDLNFSKFNSEIFSLNPEISKKVEETLV